MLGVGSGVPSNLQGQVASGLVFSKLSMYVCRFLLLFCFALKSTFVVGFGCRTLSSNPPFSASPSAGISGRSHLIQQLKVHLMQCELQSLIPQYTFSLPRLKMLQKWVVLAGPTGRRQGHDLTQRPACIIFTSSEQCLGSQVHVYV